MVGHSSFVVGRLSAARAYRHTQTRSYILRRAPCRARYRALPPSDPHLPLHSRHQQRPALPRQCHRPDQARAQARVGVGHRLVARQAPRDPQLAQRAIERTIAAEAAVGKPAADQCQGPATPAPGTSIPSSQGFPGSGNPPAPRPRCPKGKVRKHGKCVRTHRRSDERRHGRSHGRAANNNRGGAK